MIFERHHKKLFTFFLRTIGRRQVAEDLTQEVFVRMLKSRQTFRGDRGFGPWMFRVAKNVRADYFDRLGRAPSADVAIEVVDPMDDSPRFYVPSPGRVLALPVQLDNGSTAPQLTAHLSTHAAHTLSRFMRRGVRRHGEGGHSAGWGYVTGIRSVSSSRNPSPIAAFMGSPQPILLRTQVDSKRPIGNHAANLWGSRAPLLQKLQPPGRELGFWPRCLRHL